MKWHFALLLLVPFALLQGQSHPKINKPYFAQYDNLSVKNGSAYPGLPRLEIHNVDYHARLAAAFLKQLVPERDWCRIRFLSFIGQPKPTRLTRLKTLNFWVNNLHFEVDIELFKEVPGSDGQLLWFYLDDYGWNSRAFSAVANREPYCVEPFVFSDVAERLREYIGVDQNPKTKHVEAMIRADFFFRETVESDRSTSYYDLLFAKQRFVTRFEESAFKIPNGFKRNRKGKKIQKFRIFRQKVKILANINFPADKADFDEVLGITATEDFLKKQKINARIGAIVDEGTSIVARNNRLLLSRRTPFGRGWETFDVTETKREKDFGETLLEHFLFDAQELIASLPAGGQAYLLTDKKGKRLETADPKIALDQDTRDRRVRTPGSCVICHERGIIEPPNLVPQLLEAGIDIKFKKKDKARDNRAFFLNWQHNLRADQTRYEVLILKTSGLKPANNVIAFQAYRDQYDAPVTVNQAALEAGVPTKLFKLIASRSPRVRLLMLVQGKSIPRATWEGSIYREFMLLLTAARNRK